VARLYASENFPLPVVEALRALGHDILTVREAGHDNQRISDEDVLSFAAIHGRAVITINRRDFVRLHRQHPAHQGLIVCTEDNDIGGQARRIDAAIASIENLAGALIRVNRPAR
jgi:hypothetical protein